MTEELRKEAITTVQWECTPMIDRPTFINGYITGAEPREKQIAELEEKVANLEYLLEGRDNEIDELKEQNTNLQTMLKAEREVRCNEDYLKRVTDLEAQIEQNKIDLAISEHDREHNDYELTEVYTKVEQLEKENAELKEKLKPENCIEYLARGGYVKFLCENGNEHDQLTKAKEIINGILEITEDYKMYKNVYKQAKQFLNSEVEK